MAGKARMKWSEYKSNLLPVVAWVALAAEAVWFAASLTPWLDGLPVSPWGLVGIAVGLGAALLVVLLLLGRGWERPSFLQAARPATLFVVVIAANVGFALRLRPWLEGLSFNRWWLTFLLLPIAGATSALLYRVRVDPELQAFLVRSFGAMPEESRNRTQSTRSRSELDWTGHVVLNVFSLVLAALVFGNGALALWLEPRLLRLPFLPGWLVVLSGITILLIAVIAGWWRGAAWIARVPFTLLWASVLTATAPLWGLAYALYALYRERLDFGLAGEGIVKPRAEVDGPGSETDEPITGPDRDRFDFQDYAAVLAGRVVEGDTPLTIGVFGSWGSGKTSLMRLTDAALPEETKDGDRLFKIWISVWQLGNQEEVWHAFLQALFSKVHRELPRWQRIDKRKLARQLASNSYRVVIAVAPMVVGLLLAGDANAEWSDVIAAGGTLLTVGLGLWALVKPIVETARESWTFDLEQVLKHAPYEAQITELMRLHTQFEGLVKTLVGEKGRLVAFIDDLDRCAPEKVPEVLEALKLFTATPRCVYVLGLDHARTRQGIVARYKLSEPDASAYLEKIAQLPFHLPALAEDQIADLVRADHSDVCRMCPTAPNIFSKGLEHNPRTVKRALNIYRMLLQMAEQRVNAWEVYPVEPELLAKMVVIQSRWRRLYDYLVAHQPDIQALEGTAQGAGSGEEAAEALAGIKGLKADAEEMLVKAADLQALGAMLRVEGPRFVDLDDDQLQTYFYLAGTVEVSGEQVRPGRRERDALLGGDSTAILEMVAEIQGRGVTQVWVDRLAGVLQDPGRYSLSERLSGNDALYLFLDGRQREEWEPQTLWVPAGSFLMGSDPEKDPQAYDVELPQHTPTLPGYWVGRYPVTNAEYARFIEGGGYTDRQRSCWTDAGWGAKEERGWTEPEYWTDDEWNQLAHPVVGVSWYEAFAYCRWLAGVTGKLYRLPSEAEWEKAARGVDGRIYPWGEEPPDEERCNYGDPERGTTAVGRYSPRGDSPCGCTDMAGNVWEWCATVWENSYHGYPGDDDPGGAAARVLRGGAFNLNPSYVRCAFRLWDLPDVRRRHVGFRVVLASPG